MDNLNPLVSVIIPNYNHARYLKQRLDSVFNQTYQNFEVIILDDCSTDNSLAIIEQYRDNPHLSQIVVNEVNSGSPFKQWNKGFSLAAGELIWIAESDDYCELNMLEELVSAIVKKKECVLAFSSYIIFDDDGGKYVPPIHKTQYYNGKQFVKNWMSLECVVSNASGAIFRSDVLNKVSKEYMSFKQCGDYMFWVFVAEQGSVAYVCKNLAFWRYTSGSVTRTNARDGLIALEDKKVIDYIDNRYKLSALKKYMTKALHSRKYNSLCLFDEELLQIWKFEKHNDFLLNLYMNIFNKFRIHLGVLV